MSKMNSYLDLAAVSAKVHARQSRMTRLCIFLAVALVATIFAMADMEIANERAAAIRTNGNWHVVTADFSAEQSALVATRPDVEAVGRYSVYNYRLDKNVTLAGLPAVLAGTDEACRAEILPMTLSEGAWPQAANEAVLTDNAAYYGVALGDTIALQRPTGAASLTVCGFMPTTSMLSGNGAIGVSLTLDGFAALVPRQAGEVETYLRFTPLCNIQNTLDELAQAYGVPRGGFKENAEMMTLSLQTGNSYLASLYGVAAVLFVLVLATGVLMIAGTLNSNIAARTAFFGLLRCLGATKKQVRRFVRREALQWCATAIPAGLALSCGITWGLCWLLRFLSPSYFGDMPVLGLSPIALVCGVVVGLATVLWAARAPAKRAASVSPLVAAHGGVQPAKIRHGIKHMLGKNLPVTLGCHHALAGKKNLVMVTASFALSIILFLAFTATLDFMHHAFQPLQPYAPDLSIVSAENTCSLDAGLPDQIAAMPGVKRVFGRSFAYGLPAQAAGQAFKVNLVSYEHHQYEWAKGDLSEGTITDDAVLAVPGPENPMLLGSEVSLPGGSIAVTATLKSNTFDREAGTEVLICNEQTFQKLTGETGLTILDIQLTATATDAQVDAIHQLAGQGTTFTDDRQGNQEVRGAYLAIQVFFYGFLIVIALIAALNIVNCIGMSASARMGQYGAMRAIGMGRRQLVKMLLAEAAVYAAGGCVLGCALGIPLHRALFLGMVTSHWGTPWSLPVGTLAVIVLLVAASALLAVRGPAKRLQNLSIVDALHAE